jgi:phage shock protein PspC (stress-responsive transcriptional regulator)
MNSGPHHSGKRPGLDHLRRYLPGEHRPDGALLAGVCAGIARAMTWNVWVIRGLFVGFLALKTMLAIVVYLGIALVQHVYAGRGAAAKPDGLVSPELADRDARISALDRRFRELEDKEKRERTN